MSDNLAPNAVNTTIQRREVIAAIKKNRNTLVAFMARVAKSKALAKPANEGGLPTTQKFISSLYNYQDVHGFNRLSDAQKEALHKTIDKYAMIIAPVIAAEKNRTPIPAVTSTITESADDESNRQFADRDAGDLDDSILD